MPKNTWTAGVLALAIAAASQAAFGDEPAAADRIRRDLGIEGLAPGVRVGVDAWRGPAPGAEASPAVAWEAEQVLPTASSIKTAIMIEMFARFPKALDQPAPGLDEILKDDHPAIAHFAPPQRDAIRAGLSGASVRRIGRVMLGSEGASNLVYNAASNVAIALLGGPDETTRRIHERAPEFAPIMVRRYMLTDRKARGDNEATAAALLAVVRRLALRDLPGLDAATVEACRMVVQVSDDPARGRRRSKGGALDSLPITRVSSGWYERPGEPPVAFVVMLALAAPGENPMTLPHPSEVAPKMLPLLSPSFEETGLIYSVPEDRLLHYRTPE